MCGSQFLCDLYISWCVIGCTTEEVLFYALDVGGDEGFPGKSKF